MPELPEVETFRKFFEENGTGKKIKSVKIRDIGILSDLAQETQFEPALKNQSFQQTLRHGKFLFVQASNQQWVMIHFGMSGYLRFESNEVPYHKHDRVIFSFTNQHYLAFNCMRKFGTFLLTKSPEEIISQRKLGPDAIKVGFEEFYDHISSRKRSIKSALLDQSVLAGVGNLYADETLFQAKIHPQQSIQDLTKQDLKLIHKTFQDILNQAVTFKADYGQFPAHFFIHARKKEGACPQCDTKLERIQITQRTTFFCPNCQPLKTNKI